MFLLFSGNVINKKIIFYDQVNHARFVHWMIYLDKWINIKYQTWHINYVTTIFWLSSTSVWKLRLKNSHEQKMFLFRFMDLSFWVNLVSNFLSKLCNVTTIFKSVKSFRTFFKQCINLFKTALPDLWRWSRGNTFD